MKVTVEIEINKSKDIVWSAITDIENSDKMISGILKINVLNQPAEGLIGFKWEETREMFGQKAMETMWITESIENEYYCTRAESHGAIYITRLILKEHASGTLLSMTFSGEAQTRVARTLSFLMSPFIKKAMKKALLKDLQEIKAFVENKN